ncbi:MAG: hypothetical protein IT432_00810 [Phycisphaerales bacterium]|nr:hypothetical protein [Phycisphaerales bacterium]
MNTTTSEYLDFDDSGDLHRGGRIPPGSFFGGDELPPGTFHGASANSHEPTNWVDDRVEINPPLNHPAPQAKGEPRPLIPPGRPA